MILPVHALLACVALGVLVQSVPLALDARQTDSDPLLQVNTTSGAFSGVLDEGVYRYLGIPYGASTGGSNRFLPPTAAPRSPDLRDASQWGQTCPQYLSDASKAAARVTGQAPIANQGEDCLHINVWVGKNVRQQAGSGGGAPVLLWIYGGSFTWGSPLYTDGQFLPRNHDDVVIMSISYRLNIFGFPRAPQLQSNEQGINLGLLDRDLAISWVRDNAASFGGDGNRIILWGQSAGGSSVDAWAYSHSGQDGFASSVGTGVAGLIIESGAVQGLDTFVQGMDSPAPSSPLSSWNQAAQTAGCGTNGDEAQLACMRQKPFSDLITAIGSLTFAPTPDAKTWFSDFSSRAAAGKFARLPLLLGSNADEGTVLLLAGNTTLLSGVGDAIITPLVFQCPARRAASERSKYGVPTYRYLYGGNWDDMNSGRPELNAYHGSEVPIVWGFYNTTPLAVAVSVDVLLASPTLTLDSVLPHQTNANEGPNPVAIPPAQKAVSEFMMASWTTFAKDPAEGLSAAGETELAFRPCRHSRHLSSPLTDWPKYDASSPTKRTVAAIAIANSATVQWRAPEGLGCTLTTLASEGISSLLGALGGWL